MVFPHKRNFAQHIVSQFLIILDKYSVIKTCDKTLTNILQIFIKKVLFFCQLLHKIEVL